MRISDWSADGCSSYLPGLCAYLFARGWIWAGALLLHLATPLAGIAVRLAALRLQARPGRGWWRFLLPALSGAALGTLSLSLSQTRGWGCLALAATTLAFLVALDGETRGREVHRSEERRVGKECVSTCRSRWSPDH